MPVFVLQCFKVPGHGCKYIQGWIKLLTCNVLPTSTPLRLYFFLRANMKLLLQLNPFISKLSNYKSVKLKGNRMSARQLRIIAAESSSSSSADTSSGKSWENHINHLNRIFQWNENVNCSSKACVGLAGEAGIFQTNYRNAKLSVSSASL